MSAAEAVDDDVKYQRQVASIARARAMAAKKRADRRMAIVSKGVDEVTKASQDAICLLDLRHSGKLVDSHEELGSFVDIATDPKHVADTAKRAGMCRKIMNHAFAKGQHKSVEKKLDSL